MSFWRDKFDPPEVRKMIFERDLKNLEKEKIAGLDEIIHGFIPLRETGIYEDLKEAYHVKKIVDPTYEEIIACNMPDDSVFMLASNYLSHSILKTPFTDLISFTDIYHMYRFLGLLYYTKSQNPSDLEDFLQICNSGLDKNLIFFQDNFDENSDQAELSPEFFQKLKEVRWKDHGVKKFFDRLEFFRTDIAYPTIEYVKFADLSTHELVFVLLISACRAVKENRLVITKNDVIVGYKTYLKLLNTDFSKYGAENFGNNGYLVCENCNGYYKLQPDESPEDFTDECECGGKLKYYEDEPTRDTAVDDSKQISSLSLNNLGDYIFRTEPNLKREMMIWGVGIGILAIIELFFAFDILLHIEGEPVMLGLSFLLGICFLSLAVLSFHVSTKKIYWGYAGAVIGLLLQAWVLTDMSMSVLQIVIFFLPLIYFVKKAMIS